MAKVNVNSPRPKDPTGMNTDRYYAGKTRSVISNKFFSERKGTATKPTVPARPAMVFKSEDSNANKYYQENYGLRKKPVNQPAAAPKPVAAPVPAVVAPAPKPVAAPTAAIPPVAPKAAPKMPAAMKTEVFSFRAGEQLGPSAKVITQKLVAGEKVRVETKSKTLLTDFDKLIEEAVNAGTITTAMVTEQLSRKLNGKPAPPLVFTVDEGFEEDMPELSVDQMKSVVAAKDPEARLAELADKEEPKPVPETAENYFGDEPEAEDVDDEDEDDIDV